MPRKEAPSKVLLSDEEIRQRMLANPDIVRRAQEALERIAERESDDPDDRITAEQLPDYLRERGWTAGHSTE